jgi:hypothetical protein
LERRERARVDAAGLDEQDRAQAPLRPVTA